jgi:hypothetical protein
MIYNVPLEQGLLERFKPESCVPETTTSAVMNGGPGTDGYGADFTRTWQAFW